MRSYESNQQFYDHIDEVVVLLRNEGYIGIADQVDYLLHSVAWTTTSELFGELRNRFEQALNSGTPLLSSTDAQLRGFVTTIDQAWERANGAV